MEFLLQFILKHLPEQGFSEDLDHLENCNEKFLTLALFINKQRVQHLTLLHDEDTKINGTVEPLGLQLFLERTFCLWDNIYLSNQPSVHYRACSTYERQLIHYHLPFLSLRAFIT
jgi:hypothetical protein